MDFIKKHWSNILFFGLIIFMFTPAGMPLRAWLIKGVSFITSRVENLEIDKDERIQLSDYNWQLIDQEGNPVDFSSFKGKVLLINNWATTCPPCVAEMPSLQKLYDSRKDEVFFLFIAHDRPGRVKDFLQKNNLHLPVYYIQSAVPKELKSPRIPTTFIIDKQGNIVVHKTGAVDWDSSQVHKILDKYAG